MGGFGPPFDPERTEMARKKPETDKDGVFQSDGEDVEAVATPEVQPEHQGAQHTEVEDEVFTDGSVVKIDPDEFTEAEQLAANIREAQLQKEELDRQKAIDAAAEQERIRKANPLVERPKDLGTFAAVGPAPGREVLEQESREELRHRARERDLSPSGTKAELVDRIEENNESEGE